MERKSGEWLVGGSFAIERDTRVSNMSHVVVKSSLADDSGSAWLLTPHDKDVP